MIVPPKFKSINKFQFPELTHEYNNMKSFDAMRCSACQNKQTNCCIFFGDVTKVHNFNNQLFIDIKGYNYFGGFMYGKIIYTNNTKLKVKYKTICTLNYKPNFECKETIKPIKTIYGSGEITYIEYNCNIISKYTTYDSIIQYFCNNVIIYTFIGTSIVLDNVHCVAPFQGIISFLNCEIKLNSSDVTTSKHSFGIKINNAPVTICDKDMG